jgi:hypothetical protein
MKPSVGICIVFFAALLGFAFVHINVEEEWGFFGHRRLNRLAVFTLPVEMMPFFREHIDFITDHAIDPDKRRYATKHEGVRHYIDLDEWGSYPFDRVPRKWSEALAVYSDVYLINGTDTTLIYKSGKHTYGQDSIHFAIGKEAAVASFADYNRWFTKYVLPDYYEDEWLPDFASFKLLFGEDFRIPSRFQKLYIKDQFSSHGILPYHLISAQKKLTEAFKRNDTRLILRLCTDFGHYIGDAHVPLHTTKNYNGQLSNQDGIHAFWESRIPELFADEQFDMFVGQATYISDPDAYYWNIVLESHLLVDSVLEVERNLRKSFPVDQQMCFDNRLGQVVRTQCREFADAYNKALKGQIEERFRKTIHAIGSAWYTAWIDAGQPKLHSKMVANWTEEDKKQLELESRLSKEGPALGRPHDN